MRRPRILAVTLAVLFGSLAAAADEPLAAGQRLFVAQCAACHGDDGQGGSHYEQPLVGDLSVAQLTELIAATMPQDMPGSLSPDEAQTVAAYVHDAFYSEIARARNQPARIELARLTERQYRQSVADLVGSFGPPVDWNLRQGLHAEFYWDRKPGGQKERAATRLDRQIDFDFGVAAPVPEIEEPREFSIRWTGSVLAPQTGEYEFVIRTDHAARLWVNARRQPTIDAWVKSGDATEYRASLFLIGGRRYSLRLEFSKAPLGVDETKKDHEKKPSAPAFVALRWQRPGRIEEQIAGEYLSPATAAPVYICTTPFPPDDRSLGWLRGTSVSKAWDEATTAAAIETKDYVLAHLNRLADTRDDASDRAEKLGRFSRRFVERAFRVPLDEALAAAYVDRQFAATADPESAVARVVVLALKSPRFLFRELVDVPPAYATAARLSFGLWDSLPDERLLTAAGEGGLSSADALREHARRMLRDQRAQARLRDFLLVWVRMESSVEIHKDGEQFAGFDAAVADDLRTSLEMFFGEVLSSPGADFRELLLADYVFLNKRLAEYYHAEAHPAEGFVKARLDETQRAGVLTHPYVLARLAYSTETSPIHRGVFVARSLLDRFLKPPPEAFAPLEPQLHPDLTTRERVALQTRAAMCMNCHDIINPLGFTLERFDAAGRFRESDRGRPIDDTAEYTSPDGQRTTLRGARQLAEFLASNPATHSAFVEQLFHHLVQQPVRAYGATMLDDLCGKFSENDFNIRALAVEIMVATAAVGRETDVASLSPTQ